MPTIRGWLSRLRHVFNKQGAERDLVTELESHLQFHIEDNLRSGMSFEQARRQALIKLGGLDQTKESARAQRSFPIVENVFRDFRIAIRVLCKDPRFSVLAALGLGLGLGITTAIFTLINASVRYDRVAGLDSASYVGIFGSINSNAGTGISYPDFRFYQAQATSFSVINAESEHVHLVLATSGSAAEDASGRFESEDFLSVVGLKPALGRMFTRDEAIAGSPVVVLNYRFWKNRFGGDQNAIGSQIRINSQVLTVIGIAGERYSPRRPYRNIMRFRRTLRRSASRG